MGYIKEAFRFIFGLALCAMIVLTASSAIPLVRDEHKQPSSAYDRCVDGRVMPLLDWNWDASAQDIAAYTAAAKDLLHICYVISHRS